MPATGAASFRHGFLNGVPGHREAAAFAAVLALLAGLPLLVASIPLMSDYPSHLARWHIMLDQGRSPWLARHYAFEWRWSGNLGADILIWPFARIFGLEAGGRILAALTPISIGLGLIAVEWSLRKRLGVGTLLAIATIWSRPLVLGFLNFGLSLAFALFAFALWVRLEDRSWRWICFVPIGFAVWLCHLAGWGVLGILIVCYEVSRRFTLGALLAPWPLAFPAAVIVASSGAPARSTLWGGNVIGAKVSIWLEALRDRSMNLDVDSVILILLAIVLAGIARKLDRRLGWAALTLAVLSLALPRHFGGGDYADLRLAAVALTIGCLAIDWQAPRWAMLLAPALFLVRLGVTTQAWHEGSRKSEVMLGALDHIPAGARVASAVAEEKFLWGQYGYEHLASYATIRRDALVNTHFAIPGIHMLRLRDASENFADPRFRIDTAAGEKPDLSGFAPAREADYLWYIGEEPPARLPEGSEVIFRAEGTLLARLAKAPAAR